MEQRIKPGDRVRIVSAEPPIFNGKTGKFVKLKKSFLFGLVFEVMLDNGAIWLCDKIEPVKEKHPVIVITTDGKTTTATMREGKKVLKTAEAKCNADDTFDFAEGARIAFERLQGRDPFPEEKKPEFYDGKVVCVKSGNDRWTIGKIYPVTRGFLRDSNENLRGPYKSLDEMHRLLNAYFIEVKD